MSLFKLDRRLLILTMAATLAACGYSPAYGPTGAASNLHIQVAIDAPGDKNEFDYVERLELRLGHAVQARYQLSYKIDTALQDVGLTSEQEIIRYNIFGKVKYTLTDIATGVVLTSSSTDTFTGYSVGSVDTTTVPPSTNATISTLAAERDAFSRLMVALADQTVTQLVASSGTWAR